VGDDGPVALVTGGTRGIGRAITERLLSDGWSVLATYHSDDVGAEALRAHHPRLAVRRSDSACTVDCDAAVADVLQRFGHLDHLVASASTTRNRAVVDLTDEEWDGVIATNLSGSFRMARAALGAISASPRGRIVMVSSVAATMGNANQGAYAASKAGLLGLARSLARELAPTGTTVNLVVPGPTESTGMTADYNPAFVAAIARKIPLQRLGRPEETAHAVRMLLDDLAAYITGSSVVVDGGLSM